MALRMHRWTRRSVVVSFLLASLALSAGAVAALATGAKLHPNTSGQTGMVDVDPRPSIGGWPSSTNPDGTISDGQIPELIRAQGDSGIVGYVRYEDYMGPTPSNPEEALAQDETFAIPVYASDGVTVVDHLTLAPGSPPPETPAPSE